MKLRFSNTVLAYGDLRPNLPVLSHDNSRLLPESFTGTMLTSTEIEGLEFNAGTFHAQSRKSDEGRDSGGLKGIDVIGASYKFNDALSGAFYASDVEDVLKRQYLNLNYVLPIASNSLTFDFNGYNTKYDVTDNKNRTGPELRHIFEKNSGHMGTSGCVAWMFERRGLIQADAMRIKEDELLEKALDAGAADVKQVDGAWVVTKAVMSRSARVLMEGTVRVPGDAF